MQMRSKENHAVSEQSNTTSSETEPTSTFAKLEIFTLRLQNLSGQSSAGQERFREIVSWLSNHTIDITIDDSCARRLVMGQTMEVNLEPLPPKLTSNRISLKISSPSTSPPFQPTSDGTNTSKTRSEEVGTSSPSRDASVASGVAVTIPQCCEKRLLSILRVHSPISLTVGCSRCGKLTNVNF